MEETESSIAPAAVAAVTGPRVCGVKFRQAGKVFDYNAEELELSRNDLVLIEFEQTVQIAIIARPPGLANPNGKSLPRIMRKLTDADRQRLVGLKEKEKEAFKFALGRLRSRNIPAKMVAAELSFNEDRLTFYFASEERLDLHGLIRDLATQFRARVDVRQIGARDAAKFIGGIGSCGRELCCSTWLIEFRPVSIKMAKDQNLALNPQKVSGGCGRLLCCLTYEQDTYRDLRRGLPKIGKRVYTPMGEGRVKDVNVLRRVLRIQLTDGYEEFEADQMSPMFGAKGELLQPGHAAIDEDGEDGATEKPTAEGAAKVEGAATVSNESRSAPVHRRPTEQRPNESRSGENRPNPGRPGENRAGNSRPGDRRPGDHRPRDSRAPTEQPPSSGNRPPRRERDGRPPRPEQSRPQAPRSEQTKELTTSGAPGERVTTTAGGDSQTPGGEGGRRRRRRRRGGRGGGAGGSGGPSGNNEPGSGPSGGRQ